MSQLRGIIRYELLMAWRRRSLPLLALLLMSTMLVFGLIFRQTRLVLGDFDPVQNTVHLSELFLGEMIVLGVSVPLLLGDTIPLDRQFKVGELLDALPLSLAVYLGGKLLSVWAGLILILPPTGLISGALLYAIFAGFDLRVFAALWSTLIPLGLTVTAPAVLANATVGSRRKSVLVGLLLLPLVTIFVVLSMMMLGRVGALIDPAYTYQLNVNGFVQAPASAAEIVTGVVGMLALDGLIVSALWAFIWARLRALSAN